MNFGNLAKAFEAVVVLGDAARRLKGSFPARSVAPRDAGLTSSPPAAGLGGQVEARLTNVVVAALHEAFNRDHARLELDRAQMDEQRRRAEESLRLELRRQAADREVARLRLLAGTSMVGWIASVLLLGWRIPLASTPARIALALGWMLLLGALAAAFSAMGRVGAAAASEAPASADPGASALPMWLLILGLASTAATLLI